MSRRNLRSNHGDTTSSPRGSFAVCPLLAVMIALGVAACRAGVDADPRLPNPGAERTIVAPVFEHGDGVAEWEFGNSISENEALEIIKGIAAHYGLTGFKGGKVVPNANYMTRHEGSRPLPETEGAFGAFDGVVRVPEPLSDRDEMVRRIRPTQFARPWKFDLYDPERGIAIEFVSMSDADAIAAYGLPPYRKYGPTRTLHAARILQEESVTLTEPRVVVFFYDPLFLEAEHLPRQIRRPNMTDEERNEEIRRVNRLTADLTRPGREGAMAGARRLLGMQVEDFGQWLTERDRGQRCRAGNREDVFVSWRASYLYGLRQAEGGFCGSEKHGPWKTWYPNGEPMETGTYISGVESGNWASYYDNGVSKDVGVFSGGLKHGTWVKFWSNATLMEIATYDHSNLVGNYYRSPYAKPEMWLTASLPDGFVHVFSNGKITWKIPLKKGKAHGPIEYISYYGRLGGQFRNGYRVGRWTEIDDNGCISIDGRFRKGLQDGEWIFGGYDGESKKCMKYKSVPFSNGVIHGFSRDFPESPCFSGQNYIQGYQKGLEIESYLKKPLGSDAGSIPECVLRKIVIHPDWELVGHNLEFDEYGCIIAEGAMQFGDVRIGQWIFRKTVPDSGECVVVREEQYLKGKLKETMVRSKYFSKIQDIPAGLTGRHIILNQADKFLPQQVGVEYVVKDPLPMDIEINSKEGIPVGFQRFRMSGGRYVRECNHGYSINSSPADAELDFEGMYVDSPPAPQNIGEAHCRTWLEPEHLLLEDAICSSQGYLKGSSRVGYADKGPTRTWYENGLPRVDIELPSGKAYYYWPNGRKKAEGSFYDGARDGDWIHWRENGKVWLRNSYRRGSPTGISTYWYANGKRSFECTNKDEDGGEDKCSFWREDGTKIGEVIFGTQGEKKSWTCWDKHGSPTECHWTRWATQYGTIEGPTTDAPSP